MGELFADYHLNSRFQWITAKIDSVFNPNPIFAGSNKCRLSEHQVRAKERSMNDI